jgi:protein-S-isoprenylcysteine O-methyltransferase Ste14
MTETAPDRPGVIAQPPFIFLSFLAAGFALDWWRPVAMIADTRVQYVVGGLLIVVGFVIVAAAFRRFKRAGTNVPTPLPATALVTDGVYRHSRNPIYTAMSLVYGGIAIAADSAWVLGLLVPLLVVMRYGVIAREEVYLEAKFGDAYRDYRAKVRRWL